MILCIAFGLWLAYVLVIITSMYFVKPNHPCYTGFRIVMPDHLQIQLTQEEYIAVYAHERGHRACRHVWWNYLRAILLIGTPRHVRERQEMEADAWASKIVDPIYLASAIMKLGAVADFDLHRVNVLRKASEMLATQTSGLGAQQTGEAT